MPRKVKEPEPEPVDASGWILDNPYAEFVLMNQAEIVSTVFVCLKISMTFLDIFAF